MNNKSPGLPPPPGRRLKIILIIIFLLALLLRLWALHSCRFVGTDGGVDGVAMMSAGRNLFSGSGYSFQGRPEIVHAPLFPILSGILWRLTGDLELSGQLISVLSGALAVLAVFRLARLLFDVKSALFASLLVAVFPAFIYGATEVRLASLYSLLFLLVVICLYQVSLKPNFYRGLWAGGAVGLAYLARPEAIVFLFLGVILSLLKWGKKVKTLFKSIFLSWVGLGLAFFLLSSPYVIFLHHHLGSWTLSARAPFTFIPYFSSDWEKANFNAYAHPDLVRRQWSNQGGMPGVLKEHSGDMARRFIHNLSVIFKLGSSGEFSRMKLPPLLINAVVAALILILIGLLFYKLLRRRWAYRDTFIVILALPLIPYSFLTDFMTSQKLRYFYPYLSFALIILSVLLINWAGWLGKKKSIGRMIAGWGPAAIIFMGSLFFSIYLIPRKIHYVPYEYKLLGKWMRNNLPGVEHSTVMSQRLGVPFYAGARHVETYPGSYQEILKYARETGANYLMVNDWTTPRLRPALTFLLDGQEPPETLRKIHTLFYRGRRAILFKFK